jgi:hypothetical protein
MRRTIAPLPVDHQHQHSQPTSAPKAMIRTINVSSGTVMVVLLSRRTLRDEQITFEGGLPPRGGNHVGMAAQSEPILAKI